MSLNIIIETNEFNILKIDKKNYLFILFIYLNLFIQIYLYYKKLNKLILINLKLKYYKLFLDFNNIYFFQKFNIYYSYLF